MNAKQQIIDTIIQSSDGITAKQIANQLGCSLKTVINYLPQIVRSPFITREQLADKSFLYKGNKPSTKLPKDVIKKKKDFSQSNKAKVYLSWKEGITDPELLHEKTDKTIKLITIKIWLSAWKKNKNLPAIAEK